jgi:Flp pilus assembly protein TadD
VSESPYDQALAERADELRALTALVRAGVVTLAQVGGFTADELRVGYDAACRLVHTGHLGPALAIAEYLALIDPWTAKYRALAGLCLWRRGECREARAHLEQALGLERAPFTLLAFGEVLLALGEREQARCVLVEAARTEPGNVYGRRAAILLTHYLAGDAPC